MSAVVVACSVVTAASCSSSEPEAPLPGPTEWNRAVVMPEDTAAAASRASCQFRKGALPAETLGKSQPNGKAIPIDHIVIAMMENRSFDHYFQKARDVGLDVDVAPDGFSNPDPEGNPVPIFHDDVHCFVDTAHSWSEIRQQIGGGKMDGFVLSNEANHEQPAHGTPDMIKGNRAMGYYTEADIPFTYWMAKNFAIGDRYFSSVPTATWPNRMHLYAAQSFGKISNEFPENVDNTILDYLIDRQISWKIYASHAATFAIFLKKYTELLRVEGRFMTMDDYYKDAAAGTLPQVAFIDANGTATNPNENSDEHPPAPATIGQGWLNQAVTALAASPNWPSSAMFITYDEHGGLYDHVVPPKACPEDDAVLDETTGPIFGSYGVRVPFIAISPYAKKGYVSHHVYDHTSIVRFIEARFQIPALSHRDANAEAPFDVFDFANPPSKTPPVVPSMPQKEDVVARCNAIWE